MTPKTRERPGAETEATQSDQAGGLRLNTIVSQQARLGGDR